MAKHVCECADVWSTHLEVREPNASPSFNEYFLSYTICMLRGNSQSMNIKCNFPQIPQHHQHSLMAARRSSLSCLSPYV